MQYLYIENFKELNKACEYFATKLVLGLDVETTALEPWDGKLRLIQISDGTKTIVADVFHMLKNIGREDFSPKENFYLFSELKKLLENPAIKVVIHNSKFEQKWLIYHCDISPNSVFDTFLGAQLLDYNDDNEEYRKWNLGAVGARYLKIDLDKTQQKSDWGRWVLDTTQIDYAALDVYYLPKLREVMYSALEADGLLQTAVIDFECVPCVARAEIKGLPINREKYVTEIKVLEELHKKASVVLQNELRPTTGITIVQPKFFDLEETNYGDVSLGSSQQMLKALSRLGVPVFGSTDVENIAKHELNGTPYAIGTGAKAVMHLENDYPIIKLLQDFRGVDKQLSAFGYSFLEHLMPDEFGIERVHPTFFIIGAVTGRMSSRNPNVQQIPNGSVTVGDLKYDLQFRKTYEAPEGRKFVLGDYGQIELRIATEFSNEPVLIEAFTSGKDPHAATAASCFHLPYEECIEGGQFYHDKRTYAKRINFGIIYGLGAPGLSGQLQIPVEEAQQILEQHRAEHPTLWRYLDKLKLQAKKSFRARTASGRVIRFTPPEKDALGNYDRKQMAAIARIGTNQPIQGTSVDMLKIALKLINDKLQGLDACVVNTVHDEIMIECDEKISLEVKDILESSMKEAGEKFLKNVPIEAAAKIIDNWGQK